MALSYCTENASEVLGRRRTDFIRMLPKRNYGEAALTILGVKPVSIISGAEPVLKFLLERPAELHGLGVSLHRGRRDLGIDYLLVNRWAVAAIESPLFSNFKSREHAIYEVFNSQEMMDNHGGLFLGYAQCYRPRALSYVFRWSAFSKSEDERNSLSLIHI